MMPVLLDFHWCHRARDRQRRADRRTKADARQRPTARAALVDRVIAPLAGRFGHDPRILRVGCHQRARVGDLRLGNLAAVEHASGQRAARATSGSAAERLHALAQASRHRRLGQHAVSARGAGPRPRLLSAALVRQVRTARNPLATPVACARLRRARCCWASSRRADQQKTPAALIATARAAGYLGRDVLVGHGRGRRHGFRVRAGRTGRRGQTIRARVTCGPRQDGRG